MAVKDLSRPDNYGRVREMVSKGYVPTEVRIHYVNEKESDMQVLRLTVPKKGTASASVMVIVEGDDDIAVVGGFSDALLFQLWLAIEDKLGISKRKKEGKL